jgi:hypothetical protein
VKLLPLAAALAWTLLTVSAQAAPIYRCGQTYSQTPCPGGRVIDSSDPRTAAQRAEAKEIAAREKKLAAQMERDRRAREAGEPPAPAAGFDSRAASAPASAASAKAAKPKSNKKKKGGKAASSPDFVAVEPTKPKAAK